jgi:hypothetical protein
MDAATSTWEAVRPRRRVIDGEAAAAARTRERREDVASDMVVFV